MLDKHDSGAAVAVQTGSVWDSYIDYSRRLVQMSTAAGESVCVLADCQGKPRASGRYYEHEILALADDPTASGTVFNVCMLESHASQGHPGGSSRLKELCSHRFPWRLRHRRRVKMGAEGLSSPQTVPSTLTFRSADAARRRGHSRKRPKPLTGLPTIPLEVPSAVPPTAYARTASMSWAPTDRAVFCSRGCRKIRPRLPEPRRSMRETTCAGQRLAAGESVGGELFSPQGAREGNRPLQGGPRRPAPGAPWQGQPRPRHASARGILVRGAGSEGSRLRSGLSTQSTPAPHPVYPPGRATSCRLPRAALEAGGATERDRLLRPFHDMDSRTTGTGRAT